MVLCVLVALLATGERRLIFFGSTRQLKVVTLMPLSIPGRFIYGVWVSCKPPGSTGLVCYTAVESLDLGCLLRWDCPHASSNTTYTVQTKTQG